MIARIGLALLLAASVASAEPQAEKPSFVFILIDDLGWRDVGFQGECFFDTPRIDALAEQGMVFTSAYANAPNCAPTRACLMSGQYTPRHGVYTVGSSERGKAEHRRLIPVPNRTDLADEIETLPEALKSHGYVCASIGKWHLGADPRSQGFDVNVGGFQPGSPPGGYFSPYENRHLEDGPEGEYLTDRLTEEAIEFLRENRERPFFLYLSHYAVHTPTQAKEELVARYRDRPARGTSSHVKYAAQVTSADESVGRVLDALDELDLAERTVVVFFSDNGGYAKVTSMRPLRGAKGMLYEGGIRVPMAVRWPGRIPPGSRCDEPVIGIDFYPTFLELAGAEPPEEHELDGLSLAPLLLGTGRLEREAIFWHFPAYLQAYVKSSRSWRTTPAGAVRAGRYKLVEFFEDGRLELYDLLADVGETRDRSGAMPEKTAELHRMLREWREAVDAPVPTEPNPEYEDD